MLAITAQNKFRDIMNKSFSLITNEVDFTVRMWPMNEEKFAGGFVF